MISRMIRFWCTAALLVAVFASSSPAQTPDDPQTSTTAVDEAAPDPSAAPAETPPETATTAPKGFFQIVFSGGISGILIMLALIGLSLTAAYLFFEQLLTLRRRELLPEGLSDSVRQLVASGRHREAMSACEQRPSLLGFVLLHGLEEIEGGWAAVEKAVEDALAEQSARLFRKVEYLSVIGNIAPMLGLLGTVVGMIFAFERVASTQGAATAGDLAEGIYEALVTTVAGLVIAIPALGAFAVFRNRVDELIAEAAYLAQHALGPLKRSGAKPATATAATAATGAATPRRAVPPPPPAGGP